MFAFSVFQIWLPLGYVFDVNAAQAPVRGSEFYQRKQMRAAGSPPCRPPSPDFPASLPGPLSGTRFTTGLCVKPKHKAPLLFLSRISHVRLHVRKASRGTARPSYCAFMGLH